MPRFLPILAVLCLVTVAPAAHAQDRPPDVKGLFLMAPPVAMGKAPPLEAADVPTGIVHGWHDELIPAPAVVEWAARRSATLLLVDDTHRLSAHVQASADAFAALLARL